MNLNDEIASKRCFKCDQQVLGSLNIVCNTSNSMIILWNKHQIFVYEDLRFTSISRSIEPEFQILDLLLFNNHLACLDCTGNIHVISLKFKNSAQKRLKSCFHPRKQNIIAFSQYSIDIILTLEFIDTLYLCLHQINRDFQLDKKFQLILEKEQSIKIKKDQKCILKCHSISESNLNYVKEFKEFNENASGTYNNIIVVSFDNFVIYACLIGPNLVEDEIKLMKLYSCPSEICNIQIIENDDLKIVVGLSVGSVIVIPLKGTERKPEIVHLNTAIYKFLLFENTMIYTDGSTMWKTEKIFTKEINFIKLFVKQVKDFVIIHENIICTTFSNIIYVFGNDESASVKVANGNKYTSADDLLNNMECINEITNEINKNDELLKKLSKEQNYITALSLSKRQDIMNDVINTKIIVYENYEDAIKEYTPITLTEEIEEYFKPESNIFLINIIVNTVHSILNNVLSNIFSDMKIHINFSTKHKLLKTTSLKLVDQLKKVNYVIPLKTTSTRILVNIAFVTNIPGVYNEKHTSWTMIYQKQVQLNSEHFIKTNNATDQIVHLKNTAEPEEMLLKINQNIYGDLFKFTDISKLIMPKNQWSLYVKLPKHYPDILKNSDYCEWYLNFKTSDILTRQYTSEEFLKSKNKIVIMVGDVKIRLDVVNDGFSNAVLRISGGDLKIATDIRNFFADIIYDKFIEYMPDEEFISQTFYTTVENLQKAVRTFITKGSEPEEFNSLAERFERNVIGALPM